MTTVPTGLAHGAVNVGDLGWFCRSMAFSWRGTEGQPDARALFADIFGFEAENSNRNKFPTASMPCRSWAQGVSGGTALELCIGVDSDLSQMRLVANTGDELMSDALTRFKICMEQLEAATSWTFVDRHAVLELLLPDGADHIGFRNWLGLRDWQAHAWLLRQGYVFSPRDRAVELSIGASVDRRARHTELTVGVATIASVTGVGSSELFKTFDWLFSTQKVADLATP